MDQQKIGAFLKELRKEKGITQEQFAAVLNVSNRTVSRWENGINLPDIDLMIMISDYYAIDLRELLDGERNNEKMNQEVQESVLRAVDYTNEGSRRYFKKQNLILLAAVIYLAVAEGIDHTSLNEIQSFPDISAWLSGVGCSLIIVVILTSNRKIRNRTYTLKQRLLDEWIFIPLGWYNH